MLILVCSSESIHHRRRELTPGSCLPTPTRVL
ncbi:mCG1026992 [Mus musculus]|nr:mCG1026992 [Mus musculus]